MSCECDAFETPETAITNNLEVRDLRSHSPETLETLRGLLAGGAMLRPDAKRPHFYELEGDSCVFYVYLSPVDGSVELLATWPRAQTTELINRCH